MIECLQLNRRSSLFYNTNTRHERHEWEWETQVRRKCEILILTTTRVKTYFHTSILATQQMKDYKEWNNFILRTMFSKCLVPLPKWVWQVHSLKSAHFHIVTHSNTASFSIRITLCETINILPSKNYWKLGKMNAKFWKNIR